MAEIKQRNQLIALVVLLATAASVWYYSFGKPKTSSSGFAKGAESYTPINAQDLGSIFEKLKTSQTTEYKSSGRNIFIVSAAPVAAGPIAQQAPQKSYAMTEPRPLPPPPPAQLPANMKFFGYGSLPSSGTRRAFLLEGEEVHIVGEGETLLNHLRITHIGNDRIEFEDTNTGQRGFSQLEAQGPMG